MGRIGAPLPATSSWCWDARFRTPAGPFWRSGAAWESQPGCLTCPTCAFGGAPGAIDLFKPFVGDSGDHGAPMGCLTVACWPGRRGWRDRSVLGGVLWKAWAVRRSDPDRPPLGLVARGKAGCPRIGAQRVQLTVPRREMACLVRLRQRAGAVGGTVGADRCLCSRRARCRPSSSCCVGCTFSTAAGPWGWGFGVRKCAGSSAAFQERQGRVQRLVATTEPSTPVLPAASDSPWRCSMLGFPSTYAAVVLGCFALAAGAASDAAGARMSSSGVIAFTSNRDGDTEIYAMKPDREQCAATDSQPEVRLAGQLVARRPQAALLQPAHSLRERLGHERGWQRAAAAHP